MLLRLQQNSPGRIERIIEDCGAFREAATSPERVDFDTDAVSSPIPPSYEFRETRHNSRTRVEMPKESEDESYGFNAPSSPLSPVSSPSSNDFQSRSRKRKSEHQMNVLLGYYKQTPDPDLNLKRKIAEETGLTVKQVSDWFYNLRVRKKGKLHSFR